MRKQKYFTEEERIEANRAKCRKYSKTPMGRAHTLNGNYKKNDLKYNRGNGDLTAKWIHDNILFKTCPYCGRSGWEIMGCNRLDDTKPHTKDNVEPCCKYCNPVQERPTGRKPKPKMWKKVDQIDKITGEVLHQWESVTEAEKDGGFLRSRIADCCNGKRKTHSGFIWRRPLIEKEESD